MVNQAKEYTMENKKQALKAWQTKGAMGKLHNIGMWILRTLQRRDRFSQKVLQARGEAYKGPLLPHVGNITYRSSDAKSIDRAFELWDVLDELIGIAITEEMHINGTRGIPDTSHLPTSTSGDNLFLEQITVDELSLDDCIDLMAILYIPKPF